MELLFVVVVTLLVVVAVVVVVTDWALWGRDKPCFEFGRRRLSVRVPGVCVTSDVVCVRQPPLH